MGGVRTYQFKTKRRPLHRR